MQTNMTRAVVRGLTGALTLNLAHELTRQFVPGAPRMDLYGERSLAWAMRTAGLSPPRGDARYFSALAGDVASNTFWYSLAGSQRRPLRGLMLGVLGGVGAVVLGPMLGLGRNPVRAKPWTPVLTVALYALGGLATAMLPAERAAV